MLFEDLFRRKIELTSDIMSSIFSMSESLANALYVRHVSAAMVGAASYTMWAKTKKSSNNSSTSWKKMFEHD